MPDDVTGTAARRGAVERRIPRACSDVFRLWAATGLGVLLALAFQLVVLAAELLGLRVAPTGDRAVVDANFGSELIGWNGFAVSYLFLGIRAFAGCGREELIRRIKGSPLPASRLRRYLLAGGSGPTFTVGITAIAFGTIVTTVHERSNATYLVVGLVAATVTTCWMTITFAFALHYTRLDVEHGGLEFSGDDQPTLSDYAYFAIGCSATFGTTDTSVTTTRMRRNVSVHGVIALFFNTVVIAVLLSVIIS